MGGDKKAKIMGQTTKKKIREGPSVVWLLTPREKEEKAGNSFRFFRLFYSDSKRAWTKGQTQEI